MPVLFHALPTDEVRDLQSGGPDFYGQPAETAISGGSGTPCRHCLKDTPKGQLMLILSYRPFPVDQPYAEVGPIFLCADECQRFETSSSLPLILQTSPDYLIKGYSANDRIVYGTGQVVAPDEMIDACETIFDDSEVAYIHVRSARNNCYHRHRSRILAPLSRRRGPANRVGFVVRSKSTTLTGGSVYLALGKNSCWSLRLYAPISSWP